MREEKLPRSEKIVQVIQLLEKEGNISPNQIACRLGSDRRTIAKILKSASELGLVKIDSIEISGRRYSNCKLTDRYKNMRRSEGLVEQ